MFRNSFLITVSCIALGVFFGGCGDDDDDTGGKGGTGGMTATGGATGTGGQNTGGMPGDEATSLSGTITYEGDKTGPLVISVHSSFPPSMANVVGFTQVDDPTFPQEYRVEDLMPGSYFVVAYIAVGMFHVGAGPGDPQGAHVGDDMMPAPVEVDAVGATGVDLMLIDQ
jgi:hypothetical protein